MLIYADKYRFTCTASVYRLFNSNMLENNLYTDAVWVKYIYY